METIIVYQYYKQCATSTSANIALAVALVLATVLPTTVLQKPVQCVGSSSARNTLLLGQSTVMGAINISKINTLRQFFALPAKTLAPAGKN